MLGDTIGNLFGAKRNVVKSSESAMQNFREVLVDLRQVVAQEKELINALEVEKAAIDIQIEDAAKEMKNCETAITSISNLFPGLE